MENKSIGHGSLLTLYDLFNDRRFIIPDYQRGYSWETRQRKDLLEDILFISQTEHTHYTGTIVAAYRDDSMLEIVDGQQRLTTIYMLLGMILKNYKKHLLQDQIEIIEYLIGSGNKRRLNLNSDLDGFLNQILFTNNKVSDPNIKSEINILAARDEFKIWLNVNQSFIAKIAASVYKQLGFLFFTPENSKEIGIMFEVINNRGKPLSELEKLKNYLIYFAGKFNFDVLDKNVNSSWKTILTNLSACEKTSNEEEDQFLRFCWHLFEKTSKNDRYRIFDLIKEKYPVDKQYEDKTIRENVAKELNELIEILNNCSSFFKDYINASHPNKGMIHKNSILEKLSCQPSNAPIIPLYFSICLTLESEEYLRLKLELFELLEKLNFRVYICPDITKRSDTHQTELYSKAYSFRQDFKSSDNKGQVITELKEWLVSFIRTKAPISKLVEGLTLDKNEDYDFNKWNGLSYFLINYEIYLNNKRTLNMSENLYKMSDNLKPYDRIHKEHLWGKENRVEEGNNGWEDEHQKKRLGNFVLLEGGINSKCGKKSLEEKINIYDGKDTHNSEKLEKSDFLQVYEVVKLYPEVLKNSIITSWKNNGKGYYRDLYTIVNDKREERLLKFAIGRWGFDDEIDKYSSIEINSFNDYKKNEIFNTELFIEYNDV